MAVPGSIPYYPLAIDAQDFDNEVMKLFVELRPDWKREDLQTKTYSEGYINQMKRFHLSADTAKKDAIVVRVFGKTLDNIIDRKKEFLAMQLAYAAGCFQPILAIFKNGVAYQYAPGRTLTVDDLNNPRVIRAVSRKLAQLHTVDIDKVPLVDGNGDKCEFDKSFQWEARISQFMTMYPDKMPDPEEDKIFQEYGFSKEELVKMFEDLGKNEGVLGMPLCLSHGDFHIRNIVFDEESGNATFVDYEITEFRQMYSDLNSLITSRPMMEILGIVKPEDPEITEEAISLWRRSYMEAKYELSGKDPATIPDVVMEKLEVGHRLLDLISIPGLAMISVVFSATKMVPLPFIKLLPIARKKWDELKDEIPELSRRYYQLSEACKDMLC